MTIDVAKTTADSRRALKRARRRATAVVDQARSVDVPTLSDLGVPTLSDLGHRLEHVPAELEKALDHQVRAAKRIGRRAQRKGIVAPSSHRAPVRRIGRPNARRITAIVVVLGFAVAGVVLVSRKRRAADTAETPDPFGTAVRDAEEARRAASSVRA